MNRFEITPENYDKVFPTISTEEAARLSAIERHRIFLSKEDIELIQCSFSTYLEVSDPDSVEHVRIEQLGYMLENFKSKFKR